MLQSSFSLNTHTHSLCALSNERGIHDENAQNDDETPGSANRPPKGKNDST